jgi:hypothetical protein
LEIYQAKRWRGIFSARNAIVNQVNPVYYGYLHLASTDGFQVKQTSVANKLAMTNMFRFVTITTGMMLALKFAGEDEDGKILFRLKQTRLVLTL